MRAEIDVVAAAALFEIVEGSDLAGHLERLYADKEWENPDTEGLRIKASGCFNSCSQHHIADLGFLGVSRIVDGRRIAHFQLVLGGESRNNGGAYGLAIGAFPSKRIPEVIERTVGYWTDNRQEGESLKDFVARIDDGEECGSHGLGGAACHGDLARLVEGAQRGDSRLGEVAPLPVVVPVDRVAPGRNVRVDDGAREQEVFSRNSRS